MGVSGPQAETETETGLWGVMSQVTTREIECLKRRREQAACKWNQGRSPHTQEASTVGKGRRRASERIQGPGTTQVSLSPTGQGTTLQQAAWMGHPLSSSGWLLAVLRQSLSVLPVCPHLLAWL